MRIRKFIADQLARLVVAAALLVYFVTLGLIGGHSHWGTLGVPAGSLTFEDMRNVTTSWECTRRGVHVLPVNPCDPFHRPADFPRIWLALSSLDLGQGDAFVLGVGLAVVFLIAALFVVPVGASLGTGALYVASICSPAVMLGVERGNPDLAVFPLVLAAMLVTDRSQIGRFASTGLLLFASILKFYPVFAVAALARRATRASLVSAGVVAAGFIVYLGATARYVHLILASIPPPGTLAYGVRRITIWLSAVEQETLGSYMRPQLGDLLLLLAGLALGFLVARSLQRQPGMSATRRGASRDLDLFWAGACIYLGSYAIFQSQDYRLIFLLLTVPQLARWISERRRLAVVTTVALLATLWLDVWTEMPGLRYALDWWRHSTAVLSEEIPVAVIAQFVLFSCLVGWLLATAPTTQASLVGRMRNKPARENPDSRLNTLG